MADDFQDRQPGLEAPASGAFDLTPNDGADLATFTRFIHVGSAGNLNVILAGDTSAVTLTNVQVGYHPLRIKRLMSTGTTASGLTGFK